MRNLKIARIRSKRYGAKLLRVPNWDFQFSLKMRFIVLCTECTLKMKHFWIYLVKHEKWVSKVGPSWEPKIQSLARQPENWRQSLAVIQILCHRLFVVSELILGVSFHGVKVSQQDQQYKQSQHRPGGRGQVVRSFDCVQQSQKFWLRMVLRTNMPAKMEDNLKSSRMTATMPKSEKALDTTRITITIFCGGREGLKWVNDLQGKSRSMGWSFDARHFVFWATLARITWYTAFTRDTPCKRLYLKLQPNGNGFSVNACGPKVNIPKKL